MAYLHCHSCDWQQDDFYSKSYNLWTKLKSDFKWLWKPRVISFDDFADQISCLITYTHVPVLRIHKRNMMYVFSWNWLILEIVKNIKVYRKTKWKTWEHAISKDKHAMESILVYFRIHVKIQVVSIFTRTRYISKNSNRSYGK